ncbi:MAG: hypothetical protein QOJ77_1538, partial [Microbacteriaceae bacterium]|nr:hypothetical protein [Microbacteriaceae bacterium]
MAVPEELGVPRDSLLALTPKFLEPEHGIYVDYLLTALDDKGGRPVVNIALTGAYGVGKSSVLIEVDRRLTAPVQGTAVHSSEFVSLATLDPALRVDSKDENGRPLSITNFLQKEIVKQFLYREKPSRSNGSHYRRTDEFRPGRAAAIAVIVGLSVSAIAFLAGAFARADAIIPGAPTALWILHVGISVAIVAVVFFAQKLGHNRFRVVQIGAGPASVTLADQSGSYFDEYLDEIVHFFQTSRCDVVIFEDIDRFEDPHIFESLRDLNALLNGAKQLDNRPIRFVYAIKDSIFERLVPDETEQTRR